MGENKSKPELEKELSKEQLDEVSGGSPAPGLSMYHT